jgi:hypothetical protein
MPLGKHQTYEICMNYSDPQISITVHPQISQFLPLHINISAARNTYYRHLIKIDGMLVTKEKILAIKGVHQLTQPVCLVLCLLLVIVLVEVDFLSTNVP